MSVSYSAAINAIANKSFDELHVSIYLTTQPGGGVTDLGGGSFSIGPVGGQLAQYDNWNGLIGSPDTGDIVSFNIVPDPQRTDGAIGYTTTLGDGSTQPASGVFGAQIIAWNNNSVLLEQLDAYIPGLPGGAPNGSYFVVTAQNISVFDNGNTNLATFATTGGAPVVCFLRGTLIRTPSGEVPIEKLSAGDSVVTATGAARPVMWIGHGRVLATRGRRTAATPVVVRKGALAPNVPHRDLRVTGSHALFLDGVLIPAEYLVNHRSIQWDDLAQEVDLYHVELAGHDVLFANGAPAESYRDDGNRWLFHNGDEVRAKRVAPPFAPVHTGGPVVDAVWRRLLDLAGDRPDLPMTSDPDLHLLVDGVRHNAVAVEPEGYRFKLPPHPARLVVASRSAVPQELGSARDSRELGVAIRCIAIRQHNRIRLIDAADASLQSGFHEFEPNDGIRWTNGQAVLPADLLEGFPHGAEIVLRLGGTTRYVDGGVLRNAA